MQILLGYACALEFMGLRPGIYQGQWRLQHRWTGMCPHLAYLSEMPELLCCFRKSTYFPDIPKNGTWPLQRKYKQKIDTHTYIYIYIYLCMYVFKVVHFGGLLDFAHNMPCCVGAFLSTMAKQIVNLLITGPFGFFAHCPLNTCHLIVSSYQRHVLKWKHFDLYWV